MKTVNKKRIVIVVLCICAVVSVLSVVTLAAVFVAATSEKITVEIGETPEPEKIYDSDFLSSLYQVAPYKIDVSIPGEHNIGLEFFGFLPGKLVVEVCDTKAPNVECREVYTVAGTEIQAEDFIKSYTDDTEVTFQALSEINTAQAGEYAVEIQAADTSGNLTTVSTKLQVWDVSHILKAELNGAEIEKTICAKHPDIIDVDLSDILSFETGEYLLRAFSEKGIYVWPVQVSDTTPPQVITKNHVIRIGEEIVPDDFIYSVEDASAYSVSFQRSINFETQGLKNIPLLVEDIYGNKTEVAVRLLVADIPTELYLEYGITTREVGEAVLEKVYRKDRFALSDCPTAIGVYDLKAETEYGDYTVKLEIADTTPPKLLLKETTVFTGDTVSPENFILSAEDASDVIFRFDDAEIITDPPGEYTVKITVSDIHGNKTTAETVYQVVDDTVPPVIYGVSDREILVGETVSFKKGVYAVDNRDGNVSFKVDSSAVNTGEEGSYPVIYTSEDAAGNVATVTVYLKVKVNNMDAVNALADNILSWIITPSMTEREKAWAIYVWVTNNLSYSTRTSYLMGNYVDGAYSGLNIRSGNCYIYYAVSGALLSRAGIENIMIQRDKPDNPHYWNLVNIDGDWYHFDTCPHYAGHYMQCFLKTDEELANYNKYEVADYYSFDASLYPATP